MNDSKVNIKELIDNDEGLRSKRKILTVISLILLVIEFSGAKVVEANTFILKLDFSHQNGIAFLLLVSVIFLLIRYYNYAIPYHEKLYHLWTSRMLNENFFRTSNPYDDEVDGVIYELAPKELDMQQLEYDENSYWGCSYRCGWFLRRFIVYDWFDGNPEYSADVGLLKSLGFKKYIKILGYELKHRTLSFFVYRENLDVMTPYILGITAILSYFYNDKVILLLKYMSQL